ncbi:hypothetical protein LZ30DRAFT_333217 [Colletotrichum cereale]|nr:hypothetical protein LZ30DRAFT_333217 [Colletotrichum cereale]
MFTPAQPHLGRDRSADGRPDVPVPDLTLHPFEARARAGDEAPPPPADAAIARPTPVSTSSACNQLRAGAAVCDAPTAGERFCMRQPLLDQCCLLPRLPPRPANVNPATTIHIAGQTRRGLVLISIGIWLGIASGSCPRPTLPCAGMYGLGPFSHGTEDRNVDDDEMPLVCPSSVLQSINGPASVVAIQPDTTRTSASASTSRRV